MAKKRAKGADLAGNLAMVLLRYSKGLDQGTLAKKARIAASQVSEYDRGERPIPRLTLDRVADAVDFPRFLLDPLLREIRSFLAASRGWSRARGALLGTAFAELLELGGEAVETILGPPVPAAELHPPSAEEREPAAGLWTQLEKLPGGERLAVVEELEEYQTWAQCERVAAASIEEAASRPAEALKLALLAHRIAELAGGSHLWRLRLQGYAAAHVANALRVNNDLPGADAELARARKLWEDGAAEDPGLLSEAWVPWIEATLRDAQRRFPEALRRIEDALAADPGDLRAKLLLTKAQILHALGDVAGSTATLGEAVPLIDPRREPRVAFGVEFQRLANLTLEGRAAEAEPGMPRMRALGEQLGNEMDLAKVLWVEAKVAAGVGRATAAEAAFVQVRQEFTARHLAFNAALVSLDLTVLLLEQGRTAEVRQLAEAMGWVFQAQGVEREALAALRLFCEAAGKETATVELAKQLVRYLHRAEHDPRLRFEA